MLQPLSQTSKAFRDTTIRRSSREWFDAVAAQWGIPHVAATEEADWREVVRSNALGPRGVTGSVFEFVRYALAQFDTTVSVTVAAANPQRLTAAAGTPFVQDHVGLLVERQDTKQIYRIKGPPDLSAAGLGAYVELDDLTTPSRWEGANFTATDAFDGKILPFVIYETPGRVNIRVSKLLVSASPATYLQPGSAAPAAPDPTSQEPGSEAATYNSGSMDPVPNANPLIGGDARAANEPYGGHLQASEIDDEGDPLGAGPHPLYLSSGGIFDEYKEILDTLLVAGNLTIFEKGAF